MTGRKLDVALIGEFGERNYGNEASLAHLLRVLADVPEVRVRVFCHHPERVEADHGVIAQAFVARDRRSAGALGRAWFKAIDFFRAGRLVAGTDLLVVPGTGILDFNWFAPGSTPFLLFVFSLWAVVLRRPVLFLSVGADGLGTRASRAFARFAVARASLITARDRDSAAVIEQDRRAPVEVTADLVFGDAVEPGGRRRGRARPVVGLGPIEYAGDGGSLHPDSAARALYLDRLAAIADGLADRGVDVLLLRGQDSDDRVIADLLSRPGLAALRVAAARSVAELVAEIAELDAIVACRYHNLIAAALDRVPVMALGWAKQRSVLEQLGRAGDFFEIGAFDPEAVLARVDAALAEGGGAAHAEGEDRVDELARAVREQDDWLVGLLRSGRVDRRELRRVATVRAPRPTSDRRRTARARA